MFIIIIEIKMNTKYKDLIEQTFDFPQEEFHTENGNLRFHNINLAQLVEQYGTPKIHLPT